MWHLTHKLLFIDVWLSLARITLLVTHRTLDHVILLQLADAVLAECVLTRQYMGIVIDIGAVWTLNHHLTIYQFSCILSKVVEIYMLPFEKI